jgi:hypothetical protein
MSVERIETAIGTLTAIKERLESGSEIVPGEDAYEWILEVNQSLQDILDEADG